MVELTPGFRGCDTPRRALEQRRPKLALQRGDMLAQRRLRDVQGPRGACQAAEIDDPDEKAKLPDFDFRLREGRSSFAILRLAKRCDVDRTDHL